MSDDRNGANDDSGVGYEQKAPDSTGEIIRSNGEPTSPPKAVLCGDEEAFAKEVADKEVEKVMDLIAVHRESILPPAEEFNQYNENAQAVLLDVVDRQTKAIFDDESIRQDKLTEGEIRQGRIGQICSTAIILAALVSATIISLSGGSAVVAGIIMAFPFAAVIGNLFVPARSKSSRSKRATRHQAAFSLVYYLLREGAVMMGYMRGVVLYGECGFSLPLLGFDPRAPFLKGFDVFGGRIALKDKTPFLDGDDA